MKQAPLNLLIAGALTLTATVSLMVGHADLPALGKDDPGLARLILLEIRLPRVGLGLAIGGALGACGAALQGLLRNPLASPDILGTSAGAALGAVLAAYFLGAASTLAMAAGGIVGAAAALALLLTLAGRGANSATLILAGVAISALAAAATNLALALAPSPFALYDIVFWLLGSLADRNLDHLIAGLPFILFGTALAVSAAPSLDRMALGDDVAETLGVDVADIQRRVVLGTGIAIGGAVSVAGMIGFIGLVVPHLVRPLVRGRPGTAVLPSALAGAILLLLADLGTRVPVAGRILPIGVLTALIGAPFFLWLVLRRRRTP